MLLQNRYCSLNAVLQDRTPEPESQEPSVRNCLKGRKEKRMKKRKLFSVLPAAAVAVTSMSAAAFAAEGQSMSFTDVKDTD